MAPEGAEAKPRGRDGMLLQTFIDCNIHSIHTINVVMVIAT